MRTNQLLIDLEKRRSEEMERMKQIRKCIETGIKKF